MLWPYQDFFFGGESYQDRSLLIIMEDLAFNEIISYYILYHNPIQLQLKYSMACCSKKKNGQCPMKGHVLKPKLNM